LKSAFANKLWKDPYDDVRKEKNYGSLRTKISPYKMNSIT